MMRDAELVRDSFEIVKEMSTATALLFYGRLFDLDPSLRGLFHIDLRVQAKKLMDTLAMVVDSADRLEELRPTLRALGKRHVEYGVRPEHYTTVCTALLWALGQALQPDFDGPVKAAWTNILEEISREMIAGAC